MDTKALITVVVLTVLFFGFVAWVAICSRSADLQERIAASDAEAELESEQVFRYETTDQTNSGGFRHPGNQE